MAAVRSVLVFQVLLGFAFLLAFLQCSELKCSQDNWKSPRSHPKQFCLSLVPHYTASNVTSHLREQMKIFHWHLLLLRRISQGKGILLLHCGDVELNPGPFSVGQDRRLEKRDPKTKKTLRLVHLNARSVVQHFDDIVCLVSSTRPEILALSETWLDSSVGDGELYLPGYTLFRCDRSRCGGGVAMYCADHLTCSVLSCGPSASGVEYLWVSISKLHSSPLVLGCFYRPPSLPSQSVHDMCDCIEAMMTVKRM